MASAHASESPLPRPVSGDGVGRSSRRARAHRAALRYLAVWAAVAAMALIAQLVAPGAA